MLDSLSVQSKFRDIVALEPDCKVWNRIVAGLPSGQLSFLFADVLHTPLNLKRWNYKTDAKCHLCSLMSPTVSHILSCCPTALDQGRLTWRHDSVLNQLACSLDRLKGADQHLFVDLPGRLACTYPPATIPPSISSTTDRPDLVLISEKEISILELTICQNSPPGFSAAHRRKET